MKLYHGTNDIRWKSIQKTGLVPSGATGLSNWTHSIESNPDTVYLTSGYALYFSITSMNMDLKRNHKAVIIEIDTDVLDQDLLVADEDALEQASREQRSFTHEDMVQRTRKFRDLTLRYSEMGYGFEWSLDVLGTCGYRGPITPDLFSRVAFVDIRKESALSMMMMDVSVCIANHRFLKVRNENAHRVLFGDPFITGDGILDIFPVPPVGSGVKVLNMKGVTHVQE